MASSYRLPMGCAGGGRNDRFLACGCFDRRTKKAVTKFYAGRTLTHLEVQAVEKYSRRKLRQLPDALRAFVEASRRVSTSLNEWSCQFNRVLGQLSVAIKKHGEQA